MNVLSVLYAAGPVLLRTFAQVPTRYPEPSRLRTWTARAYSESGTALSESFWSVSDWIPEDWTGFTLKTSAVPVELPLPGLPAEAGVAAATAVARDAPIARTAANFVRGL